MAKHLITCPRCEGNGVLPQYYYNRKGICFLCWGKGKITAKAGQDEKPEDTYKRMNKSESDRLKAKPPRMPLPKFRNEKFQKIMDKAAYDQKAAKPMTPKQADEAAEGLRAIEKAGGKKAVAELAAANNLDTSKDPVEAIRDHLSKGRTLKAADGKPAAVKPGESRLLNNLPDYKGGPLEKYKVYGGKTTYSDAKADNSNEMIQAIDNSNVSDSFKKGSKAKNISGFSVKHATTAGKVLNGVYEGTIEYEYNFADITSKVRFNKDGEILSYVHEGKGSRREKENLDKFVDAAFKDQMKQASSIVGEDPIEWKYGGDLKAADDQRKAEEAAAKAERDKEEAAAKALEGKREDLMVKQVKAEYGIKERAKKLGLSVIGLRPTRLEDEYGNVLATGEIDVLRPKSGQEGIDQLDNALKSLKEFNDAMDEFEKKPKDNKRVAAAKRRLPKLIEGRRELETELKDALYWLSMTSRIDADGYQVITDMNGVQVAKIPSIQQKPDTADPVKLAEFELELSTEIEDLLDSKLRPVLSTLPTGTTLREDLLGQYDDEDDFY